MSIGSRLVLGFRFYYNSLRVPTATSPKVHLAMALKLLEISPEVEGAVIECGTWKGGTAANLSLVCRKTGRQLIICDSFEGLPTPHPKDREGPSYQRGDFCGALEEVKLNIQRFGAPDVCQYLKGWFEDTLPDLASPIALAYLDVDLEASLHTCVKNIWPHLSDPGYIFIDEASSTNYCSLFYSETWWKRYFNRAPPGLVGAGTGLPLGDFYIGPYNEMAYHRFQHMSSGAYTSNRSEGHWTYYPDERAG
jgi:macrocin-O-methyltransferase TylF-like protien